MALLPSAEPLYQTDYPSEDVAVPLPVDPFDEQKLLTLFDGLKREATEYRWVWEREWLRDLYYTIGRQWIFFSPTRREWVDKKLAKWIPKPVTNKMSEVVQTIRSNFSAINLEVTVRPVGADTESIAAAEIADRLGPLLNEEHQMNYVMKEADWWFITTGNACLQVSWDTDVRFNRVFVPNEMCVTCGTASPPQAIVNAGNKCPTCQGEQFQPAVGPDGKPDGKSVSFGRGKTTALSPFEYAVASNITRWDDLPYILRLRWRDKHYYEANMPEIVSRITWQKSPTDRSLQIFKSLALTNDIGTGSQFAYLGSAGSHTVEGVTEYELWMKPTPDYPDGLVMRVIGDQDPILLHLEEKQGIPGPFPYKDIEGNPLFPFAHAQYEHMGGRLWGRSAISPLIQKQDQLNQLDSLIQLIVQRMANPVWLIPESAGIEHFTGEPGLVMKWNALAAGGNGAAKPERIPGEDVPSTLYQLREQLLMDIEQLSGTFDILKGQKPSGVEAFSALQLLVERSQSRFTTAYQARGEMYRRWFSLAIELERQFGPTQRTLTMVGPNKGYTFHHFENAQLQGQLAVQVEDGSTMPKTALGKRAAIEQASQMQLLNPQDPDQKYALLTQFGLSDLVPTLNIHVQAALQVQDAFERWVTVPNGPSPLAIKPWFDPLIHWNERIKWLNTDKMRELMASNPQLEMMITMHLQQLQMLLAPPVNPDGTPADGSAEGSKNHEGKPNKGKGGGAGAAMSNSNQNSGATSSMPAGNAQTGPNVGPT